MCCKWSHSQVIVLLPTAASWLWFIVMHAYTQFMHKFKQVRNKHQLSFNIPQDILWFHDSIGIDQWLHNRTGNLLLNNTYMTETRLFCSLSWNIHLTFTEKSLYTHARLYKYRQNYCWWRSEGGMEFPFLHIHLPRWNGRNEKGMCYPLECMLKGKHHTSQGQKHLRAKSHDLSLANLSDPLSLSCIVILRLRKLLKLHSMRKGPW